MTRVSENSSTASLSFSLNKTKKKLENLQIRGSTLRNITRPSDSPLANVQSMAISSSTSDNMQYLKNANFGLIQLSSTETVLEQITDILVKAKEIAITQASDFYDANIRRNVSNEVRQLRNQALSLSNKRVGSKYLFSGYASLTKPFDNDGAYQGDTGKVQIEVSKDFFVPININGQEAFFALGETSSKEDHPLEKFPELGNKGNPEEYQAPLKRDLASLTAEKEPHNGIDSDEIPKDGESHFASRDSLFSVLDGLLAALENNDADYIRDLLPKFDHVVDRMITLRTKVGAITNSINSAISTIETDNLDNATQNSKLVDADIASLFSDITKQQNILKTTYKSGEVMLSQKLLDYIK